MAHTPQFGPRRPGSHKGSALMLVVMTSSAVLLMVGGAGVYVENLNKNVVRERQERDADASVQAALELTKTLITANVLVRDSITGKWSYKGVSAPDQTSFVTYQPESTNWEAEQPPYVVEALETVSCLDKPQGSVSTSATKDDSRLKKKRSKLDELAKKALNLKVRKLASGAELEVMTNAYTTPPKAPTLVFNLLSGSPLVELVRSDAAGDEVSVIVDAKPFPKRIRARLRGNGLCQNFDPEPVAALYRNLVGREPTPDESPSAYRTTLYPFTPLSILDVEGAVKLIPSDTSKILERSTKLGKSVATELYKMYFARLPTAAEADYLDGLFRAGSLTFDDAAKAMKSSPVYRFRNVKNDSHYYTTDKVAAKAAGFAYEDVEFYVYGNSLSTPFAPSTELIPLYSCYHAGKDIYFLSMKSDCQSTALASGAVQKAKLGYLFSGFQNASVPLYQYYRASSPTDIITSRSLQAPAGYTLVPTSGTKPEMGYGSDNDNRLVETIALYRTIFANQLLNTEAFSYNAIFSEAREKDPTFDNTAALAWLSQTFRSYKMYHDIQGCLPATPPAPRCYISGPKQVAPNVPAVVELHAYGEFTSVLWDGVEVSEEEDRSLIGTGSVIETPKEAEFQKEKTIKTASGIISSSATVSIVIKGTTLSTTCTLQGAAPRSVDFSVVPNYPALSSDYVTNKAKAPAFNAAFSFSYTTHNFVSPTCLIESTKDKSYTSAALTAPSGTVVNNVGVDKDTEFKITCWDTDNSTVINRAVARIFPEPGCCVSGCATITTGYPTPFTLTAPKFPANGVLDGSTTTSFPFTKMIGGGSAMATVNSPGGTNSCGTSITVLPIPPPICPAPICNSVPDGKGGYQTSCYSPPCYPAPIPPPSNCGTWCGTPPPNPCDLPNADPCLCPNAPGICDPCLGPNPPPPPLCPATPKQSCLLKYVRTYESPCKKDNPLVSFRAFIPKDSKVPVVDLYYGQAGSTNFPCAKTQPDLPPTEFLNPADGKTYIFKSGKGKNDWGSSDCKAHPTTKSPLMIDLSGKGITLTSIDSGLKFDIDGNGNPMLVAWPENPSNSVFLVYDKNQNGKIDSVHELFGNNTLGPRGERSANGFEALTEYDSNLDGVIDSLDPIYQKLQVWFPYSDKNKLLSPAVIKPIREVGIKSINLRYVEKEEPFGFYGNKSLQRSAIEMSDGTSRDIFDMWLASEE